MRGGFDDVLLARQRVLRFEDVITGTFADYVPKAKKTEKNRRQARSQQKGVTSKSNAPHVPAVSRRARRRPPTPRLELLKRALESDRREPATNANARTPSRRSIGPVSTRLCGRGSVLFVKTTL